MTAPPAPSDTIGVDVGRPKRLSPSSAETFRQCPRRWWTQYVARRRDPSGYPQLRGTYAHSILEYFYSLPPGLRKQECLPRAARLAWRKFCRNEKDPNYPDRATDWEEFTALGLTEDEVRQFKVDGLNDAAAIWGVENPPDVKVLGRERHLNVEIDGVPFNGYMDRLDEESGGETVVVDYKTGNIPPPMFRESKFAQVLLYAAAVGLTVGKTPKTARLVFLKEPTVFNVDVTPESLAAATDEYVGTWDDIHDAFDQGEFPANPQTLCGWCPFVADCPEGLAHVTAQAKAGKLKKHATAWDAVNSAQGKLEGVT